MRGSRLVLTIGGLVLLAVLAVVAVVTGDDEGDGGSGATTTTTGVAGSEEGSTTTATPSEPASDEEVAGDLLPAVSALGSRWVETIRDDEPSEATIAEGDTCPSGPIPEGWLVQGEQRRLDGASAVVETLSVTAGVVAEGATPADLDDPAIVTCLEDGLAAQVAAGSTVAAVEGPDLGPPPAGATVSHQRYEVTGADGTGGTFDFVLVQRGRAVSLGLLTTPSTGGTTAAEPTPLREVVAALDAPLDANAHRLR